MPYRIRKHENKYCIEHKKGGKWSVKQCSATKAKAQSALRLLHMKGYGSK